MPATTYMAVDARRDHSFRVPRPDMSVRLGTPNACTACHIDSKKLVGRKSDKPLQQYLDWIIAAEEGDRVVSAELDRVNQAMQEATQKWYPAEQSPDKTRYYEQLASGLLGGEQQSPTLAELATDLKVPAMIRASALAGLATDQGSQSLAAAMAGLSDNDVKVVSAALQRIDTEISRIGDRQQYSQTNSPSSELRPIVTALANLFDHSSKRVRIESARVFVSLGPQVRMSMTDSDQRVGFEKALDELKQSLNIENDRAAYHMVLGGIHEMMGEFDRAKDAYRAAISVESNLAGPRSNLAALLDADVTRTRQQMQQSQTSGGVTAGRLKSMLTQMQNVSEQAARLRWEEHGLLAKDIERSQGLADTHGLHYRFAMSSYLQQDLPAVEKHLLEAHRQQPEMAMYLIGLATYYISVEKPVEALKYIQPLVKMDPRHRGYQSLLEQARALEQ